MQPTQPPGATPPAGQQPANGMGIASMILGIVSIPLVCCFSIGVVTGIVAIVLGFIGKAKADRGEATNRGMAIAGIVCGFVAVGLAILFFVLYLVGSVNYSWNFEDMTNN